MSGADSIIEPIALEVASIIKANRVWPKSNTAEVFDVEAENSGEHCGKNRHHKQRVQNRPQHAQHTTAIFQLEVLGNQGPQNQPSFSNCSLPELIRGARPLRVEDISKPSL